MDTDTPNLAVDCECRSPGSQRKRIKKHDSHHLPWSSSEWPDISGRWDEVLEGQVIANTMWPLAFWTAGMCGEQDGLHSCFSDTLHSQRRVDCQGAGRLVSQAVSGRRDCCFSVRDAMCYVLSPATEGRWKSFLCMSVSQRIQLS